MNKVKKVLSSPEAQWLFSAYEWVLAILLMIGGVFTAFISPYSGDVIHYIFGSTVAILLFALAYFSSGATLLFIKARPNYVAHRLILAICYILFLFTFWVQVLLDWRDWHSWALTLGFAIFTAAAYLRYSYKNRPKDNSNEPTENFDQPL